MYSILVKDSNHNTKAVMSSKHNITKMLKAYLLDTYSYVESELTALESMHFGNKGTFNFRKIKGTYKVIDLITT